MTDHDTEVIAERVITRAAALGVRVAAAESLTGGLISAALVSVPGASKVFAGGVVAYDTGLKATLLGVDRALLDDRGPVDAEVARQMALGARHACTAQFHDRDAPAVGFGVSSTGVAGPDPDPQSGIAAGEVWIGVSSHRGERVVRLELAGQSREGIRVASVRAALELLLDEIESETEN